MTPSAPVSTPAVPADALHDSAFLRACRGEPVPHTPVWFMRQAGRSLPEYRRVRDGIQMLEACARPDLVTEITLQQVRRNGVDAAILFSDIVVPLKAVGVDLDIKPGVGPVIARPVRTAADLDPVEQPGSPEDDHLLRAQTLHLILALSRCADQVAFFYLGELVEAGPAAQIFTAPRQGRTQEYITGRFS